MAGPRGAGGTSGPGPSGPRPKLAASGDNLAWLPSALQRTPRRWPPRPQRPLPPLGQAMDRSWFSGTNVSKLLFFDLGQCGVKRGASRAEPFIYIIMHEKPSKGTHEEPFLARGTCRTYIGILYPQYYQPVSQCPVTIWNSIF